MQLNGGREFERWSNQTMARRSLFNWMTASHNETYDFFGRFAVLCAHELREMEEGGGNGRLANISQIEAANAHESTRPHTHGVIIAIFSQIGADAQKCRN